MKLNAEDYVEALRLDDAKRSLRLRRGGQVAREGSATAATALTMQASIEAEVPCTLSQLA